MLHYSLSDIRLAWAAFALLVLAACSGSDDVGTPSESAQSASEPATNSAVSTPDTQPEAPQNDGLAVREFDSVGEGSLIMGAQTLLFQVADCDLDELELPGDWVRDINVVGAGQDAGRDFFIHIKRHKQGRNSNTSVVYFYAALPAAYAETIDFHGPGIEELMQVIRKSDGGMSVMTKPDDLAVEASSVRSVEPLRMVEKTQGTMSAKLPDGVLQVECL